VRVLDNTRVDAIRADGSVTSVEAKRPDGTSLTARGKIFVLAANGMETPRLLLMSAGESRPQGIANSSGVVGRNFMEHPVIACQIKMPVPVYSSRGPESVISSSTFRDGDFRKRRPSMVISIEHLNRAHETADQLLQKRVQPPQLDAGIRDALTHCVELNAGVEQLPDPKNGITLNWDKRDRAGQPIMRFYYSFSDYERAGFAFARDMYKKMADALKAEIISISDPFPQHHLMGMTRMGTDPKASVADRFGRSHDHKNLFILSSSLFPSASAINPTLTVAALCLRAGDEIARQLAGK
jgi:choline dehydrogenase-like flavoprotein